MKRLFKVGDLIKGKENDYVITNEEMTLAKVIEVDLERCKMKIKVLRHLYDTAIGDEFVVNNDVNQFELVNRKEECEVKIDSNKITLTTTTMGPILFSNKLLRPVFFKKPKEYYINEKKKTVVLKWDDDTITKVKTSKDDKFNAKFGFLLAYFQKNCGMSRTQSNKYIDNLKVEIEDKKEKTKSIKNEKINIQLDKIIKECDEKIKEEETKVRKTRKKKEVK